VERCPRPSQALHAGPYAFHAGSRDSMQGGEAAGVVPPKLRAVGRDREADSRVSFLTGAEADRLIASYSEPAR
jgi:hypothetical protein